MFSVVRVPTPEQEDAKRTFRERQRLITERVGNVNRIKSLLATQGIYDFEPMRRGRVERLEGLKTASGGPLPPRLKHELRRQLRRLDLIMEMIDEVEEERNVVIISDEAQTESAGKIRQLVRLRGIGPEIATGLTNEVFYRHFENRRQVAGFVGLGPSPFCSGGMVRDQGISKAGPPRVRSLMIELACVSGADSKPAGKFRNKMSKLLMAPGARDSVAELNVLSLEIPERLTVELEPGVAHDLTLGIVVRIGDRNYLTMEDHRDSVVLSESGDTTIRATLRGSNKNPLKASVKFLAETAAN